MTDQYTAMLWEMRRKKGLHAFGASNARRYLALREHGVLMGMPHNMTLAHDEKLDAVADRLLEGVE